jgi:hypothetical protein
MDFMENLAFPVIQELYPDGNYHFIQDRSPIHTAIICQEWFEDNMGKSNIYFKI